MAKIFIALMLFAASYFVFNMAEFEPLNQAMNKNFQSLAFSAVLVISFFKPNLRRKLIYAASFLVSVAAGFYLINRLDLSNSFASIGIGMLLLILISYLPQLVKKGYVENQ